MKVTFGQQTTKVKQLADLLSQEISMGKYKSDCTLPSINKLSREYQVSRDTVFKGNFHELFKVLRGQCKLC